MWTFFKHVPCFGKQTPMHQNQLPASNAQQEGNTPNSPKKPTVIHRWITANYGFGNGTLYAFALSEGLISLLKYFAPKVESEFGINLIPGWTFWGLDVEFLALNAGSLLLMAPLMLIVNKTYLPKITETVGIDISFTLRGLIAALGKGGPTGFSMAIMLSKILSGICDDSIIKSLFIAGTGVSFSCYHMLCEGGLFSSVDREERKKADMDKALKRQLRAAKNRLKEDNPAPTEASPLIEKNRPSCANNNSELPEIVVESESTLTETHMMRHKPNLFHRFVSANYGFGNGTLYAFALSAGIAAILRFFSRTLSETGFLILNVSCLGIMLPLMFVVMLTYLPKITEATRESYTARGSLAGVSRGGPTGFSMGIMISKLMSGYFEDSHSRLFKDLFIALTGLSFVFYHFLSEGGLFSSVHRAQMKAAAANTIESAPSLPSPNSLS